MPAPGFNYGNAIPPASPAQIQAMIAAILAQQFDGVTAANLATTIAPLDAADLSFAYSLWSNNDLSPDTPTDPATVAAYALNALRAASQAYAKANGTVTLGNGLVIPVSQLLEGPITLPDGMMYAITAGQIGEAASTVQWWAGPTFVPLAGLNQDVRGAECDQAPGTGMWYVIGAAGGTCPPPPIGWTGDFSLVSAAAKTSIQLNAEQLAPVPPSVAAGVIPAGAAISPSQTTTSAQTGTLGVISQPPTPPSPVILTVPVPGSGSGAASSPVATASAAPAASGGNAMLVVVAVVLVVILLALAKGDV